MSAQPALWTTRADGAKVDKPGRSPRTPCPCGCWSRDPWHRFIAPTTEVAAVLLAAVYGAWWDDHNKRSLVSH